MNIIITGASRGIGNAILKWFLRKFPESLFCCISSSDCEEYLEGGVAWIKADLGTEVGLAQIRRELSIRMAGGIDILVNNAGIMSVGVGFLQTNFADYRKVLDVNLRAAFYLCQYCIPSMPTWGGKIVNIASVSGICPGKEDDTVPYSISKAGIIMLTKHLAGVYPSLCINSVSPGFVSGTELVQGETPKELIESVPVKREANPEEVADLVGYLCSKKADYITGQNFVIDGGLTL